MAFNDGKTVGEMPELKESLSQMFLDALGEGLAPFKKITQTMATSKFLRSTKAMGGMLKQMKGIIPGKLTILLTLLELIAPIMLLLKPFLPFLKILSGVLSAIFGTLGAGITEALMPFYVWMSTMIGSVQAGTQSIVLFLQEGWTGWQDYWTKYLVAQDRFWTDSEYGWGEYYGDMGLAWEVYWADYGAAWDKHAATWTKEWDEYVTGWYDAWDDYAGDYGKAWNKFWSDSLKNLNSWWDDILAIFGIESADTDTVDDGSSAGYWEDVGNSWGDYWEDVGNALDPNYFSIPTLASGGLVSATSGGTVIRAGEGGEDEFVIPRSKMGGSNRTTEALLSAMHTTLEYTLDINRQLLREKKFKYQFEGIRGGRR